MKWFLLSVGFLLFFSCKKNNRIPSNVLPREKMQAVLWDMMRADQFLSDYVLSRDSSLNKDSIRISYYQKIFAIHNISRQQFKQSFSFYSEHPVYIGAVLDSMSKVKAPTVPIAAPIAADSNITQPAAQKLVPPSSPDSFFRSKKEKRMQQAY